ncbi:MAG: ECF transporter S component [Candidatus Eremiobacterota bacterium]
MMKTRQIVLTGLFIALAILLPSFFHVIGLGKTFLPMHIPVLMAGLSTGSVSGLIAGILAPLLSSLLTGMPPFPFVIAMTCELAVYGYMTGFFVKRLNIYISVVLSMVCSRLAYGSIYFLILPLFGIKVSMGYLLTGVLIASLPGIICQFALVPVFVMVQKARNENFIL